MHIFKALISTAICVILAALTCPALTCPAQAFVHPGVSYSQTDLDRMKNNLAVEPIKTAYTAFLSSSYTQYTNTGQGPFASVGVNNHEFSLRNDATVAHNNALAWYLTRDVRYRDNALQIMNGWANTLTNYDVNDHLTAGEVVLNFCNAGEILRLTAADVWSPTQISKFQQMLMLMYPSLSTPGGGYLEAAGHGGLQMKGLFSLGVFCDRQDIFDFAVSSYKHNAGWTYGLQEYIHTSGQNYENQRDQGHASGNIGTFVINAYIAFNQGVDLFSFADNLLVKALESQAKIDLLYEVAPVTWTAADGSGHDSISPDARQPNDNLQSALAYRVYHDIKGLQMPYTRLSMDAKFATWGDLHYRLPTGKVPTAPLYGEPAAKDVVVFADGGYSGNYLIHLTAGNYNLAALRARGMKGGFFGDGGGSASSLKVPAGWTVTLYESDNFTGNSVVLTSNQFSLGDIGWNDRTYSIKVVQGGSYKISNGTYRLVNVLSGQVAEVSGASASDGAPVIQRPYSNSENQLWRLEDLGNGQYKVSNLQSDKAMQVRDASLANGAAIEQGSYLPLPVLTKGGTPGASAAGTGGEDVTKAFDGDKNTKWFGIGTGQTGWIQYRFAGGASFAVNQYSLTSANDAAERDPSAWQLQGSNNGTTWTTLDTQSNQSFGGRFLTKTYFIANTTAYAYYRLNFTATAGGNSGIQMAEFGLVATNSDFNLATGGTASTSLPGSVGEQAAQVFDGNTGTKWYGGGNGQTGWVQYSFAPGTFQTVNQYKISSANDVEGRDPSAWQFQGSNNGTNWTTLDTKSGQTFSGRFVTNTYTIANTTSFAHYRLNVTATRGGNVGIQLSELGLFSASSHQRWTIAAASGSTYGSIFTLKNVNSGKFLDAGIAGSVTPPLTQQTGSTSTSQQWRVQTP